MNKLLVATLFLTFGASFAQYEEQLHGINKIREEHAKEKKTTLKPLEASNEMNLRVRQFCEKCEKSTDKIKVAGYVAIVVDRKSEEGEIFKKEFVSPSTTQMGMCTVDDKDCSYKAIYIINSAMASSLTFLMGFVLIFRGI